MRTVGAELDAELVECNGQADHMHLLVADPPTLAISALMQRLRASTACAAGRECTGPCIRAGLRGHLRSPSYFPVY